MDPFEDLIKVSLVPRVTVRARQHWSQHGHGKVHGAGGGGGRRHAGGRASSLVSANANAPAPVEMRLRLSAHHLMLDCAAHGEPTAMEATTDKIMILHRNIDSIDRRSASVSSSANGGGADGAGGNGASASNGGASASSSVVIEDDFSSASSSPRRGSRVFNRTNSIMGGGHRSNSLTGKDGGVLHVRCKDLKVVSIGFARTDDLNDVADSLEKLAALDDVARSFPFFYLPDFKPLEDGWNSFPLEEEFSKLLHSADSEWRVSHVNKDFDVCRSYPPVVVVPTLITDDSLRASAYFRHGGRFPVLSYRHAATGQVIVRTSQPLCGPNYRRCREDERILAAILGKAKRAFIIDTRTQATSQSEKAKGGGYEHEDYYPRWMRINKSIDRYYYLLDSYSKLMEACSDVGASCEKWLNRVAVSSWLTHIKEILNCGCLIAQVVDKENASVVVHGSEGVDITLCVTALAQIILNPDCRTVRGFQALVEREWVQAGHPFWSRTTRGPFSDSVASKSRSHAPTFNIFLDCVRQIHAQFPRSFEFTESFLVDLSDHAYASQFGTFLCDCEYERASLRVKERTVSLWSHLSRPEVLETYLNCVYDPNRGIIWPSVAPISLSLWSSKYLRWILDQTPQELAAKKAQEIVEENKLARAKVLRLRKQVMEMLREAESLGIVVESNQNNLGGAAKGNNVSNKSNDVSRGSAIQY